jgi:hypothetical protein
MLLIALCVLVVFLPLIRKRLPGGNVPVELASET